MSSSATLFKKEPKAKSGAATPFFDRLMDTNPESEWDDAYESFLDYDGLLASVIREVSYILNTRRGARQAFYDEVEDDAIYFGLPALFGFNDFQSFDALSTVDRRKIMLVCEKSITLFEPRLKEVSVAVGAYDAQKQSLEISVSGLLQLEHRLERVQFPICIDRKDR